MPGFEDVMYDHEKGVEGAWAGKYAPLTCGRSGCPFEMYEAIHNICPDQAYTC